MPLWSELLCTRLAVRSLGAIPGDAPCTHRRMGPGQTVGIFSACMDAWSASVHLPQDSGSLTESNG